MNIQIQDEVIEELWKIKDQFSASSRGNVSELVKNANGIAKRKGFNSNVGNDPNKGNGLT